MRPVDFKIPGPLCSNGHKRTEKNTRWITTVVKGRKYKAIRCRICEAAQSNLYYANQAKRMKEARANMEGPT